MNHLEHSSKNDALPGGPGMEASLEPLRKPAAVDLSLEGSDLLMCAGDQTPALAGCSSPAPEGYAWIVPGEVPSLREEWAALLKTLQFTDSLEKARSIFDEMMEEDADFFASHLYALKSLEDGHLACSAGLWPGKHFEDGIRLHWVMTCPKDQNRGLARKALCKAIQAFEREKPAARLYLSTQAGSWPAIRLYESLGFEAFEEDCLSAGASLNRERWAKARQDVYRRTGIRLK